MLQLETQDTSVDTRTKFTDFFRRLSRASKRALLLDYDGTLAPFTPNRDSAGPYAGVPALLDGIRGLTKTRIVLVSGRRAFEVASLLGLKHVEIWGCHGLSRWHADGTYDLPALDEQVLARISQAIELLRKDGLSDLLELKPGAVAVHWRGHEMQANRIARIVESVWSDLRSRKRLELMKFDGGMEIRVVSRNKGDAVRTILAEMGHGATMAYLGDDQTDEDAFAALQGHGLSVLVQQRYRPTIADVWVRPPEGVIAFLTDWLTECGGAS
jgi:trehalose 6-phosphate phosphatase